MGAGKVAYQGPPRGPEGLGEPHPTPRSTDTSSEHGKTEHQPGVPAVVCREGGWATRVQSCLPVAISQRAYCLPSQPPKATGCERAKERAGERGRWRGGIKGQGWSGEGRGDACHFHQRGLLPGPVAHLSPLSHSCYLHLSLAF